MGELKGDLKKMGECKAIGSDQIPIEVLICRGEAGVQSLMGYFTIILRTTKMHV